MLWDATPEQRALAVQKMLATKKTKREVEQQAKHEAITKKHRVKEIEGRLADIERMEVLCLTAYTVCHKSLATEAEIVAASDKHGGKVSGVYFLVKGRKVVYVGQSVNVYSRIAQHYDVKDFDAMAYVPCSPENLDVLESLYIHTLRPPLNGAANHGGKSAPLSLQQLLKGM